MPASPGALRFNTDSNKLELYDGNQWTEIVASSPDSQTGGARGLFFGGGYISPAINNSIDYITISTTGNSIDFGDLTERVRDAGACASSTRGVRGGGVTPTGGVNTIDYVTISSTGNAQDFGDLTNTSGNSKSGLSNQTRGIFGGGFTTNIIDYITIASTGNAVNFGYFPYTRTQAASCASSTRGVFAGGSASPLSRTNTIDFITISTLGNAADFGDLNNIVNQASGCSNAIRGLFAGGYTNPAASSAINVIDFITIATLGNARDFGDLTTNKMAHASCSNSTRGVFAGGYGPTPAINVIEYVSIMNTGNAIDFGDLVRGVDYHMPGTSNGHGGL